MKVGVCKLCSQERALAKAHVVPKAFYKILPQEPLMLFSGKKGSRPKRVPIGVYDEDLLCEVCEETFSHLDDEAAQVLKPWPRRSQMLKDENGFIIKLESKKAGYFVDSSNAEKLLLFFHFLLWRMAETNRPEMKLKLEPTLVERLRSSVLTGAPNQVGLRIFATRSGDRAAHIVASPRIGSVDGAMVINVDFYGFQFKIKFADDGIDEFSLSEGHNWPILFEDFRTTKFYKSARAIAKETPNPWARLQAKR